MSTPTRSSRMVGPVSTDLLQPSREFSLPTSQCDGSNPVLAVITIAPPAYVLFPFADPFDSGDVLSAPRFPPLPAPPSCAPIGPPGSLAVQSVILDTMSRGLSSSIQLMSLINSGPLSPGQAQPLVIKTSPVRHTLSSHIHMASVDSPIESVLTERSRPLTPAVQDICLSAIVSSTARSNRWSLSPNSVPLIVQQARHLSYVIALPSVCPSVGKALLLWRTSTLGLGTTWGVVPTGSQLAGTLSDFADHDGSIWITTSPPTVPGVGGSTGICLFIGPESQ